jgi:hypothetical protein
VLNGRNEKLSLTIRKETRVSTLSTHIYYRAETPKQTNKERESNESDTSRKGSNQNIPIWRWYHPVLKKPKHFSRILSDLISPFSNFSGYKINIQNSVAWLYAQNELAEKKTGKQSHVIIFPYFRKTYLGINLSKLVKYLYIKKYYKKLKKEIEENIRRWKDALCSWMTELILQNWYTTKANI